MMETEPRTVASGLVLVKTVGNILSSIAAPRTVSVSRSRFPSFYLHEAKKLCLQFNILTCLFLLFCGKS